MDIVAVNNLLREVTAVQAIHPVHEAQRFTDLKLSGLPLGPLMNFNEPKPVDGIRRRLL